MLRSTPLGWPLHYVQHERDVRGGPAPTRLHGLLRDLDLGAWYLPFGWFLIAALRAFRSPPYGHFGLGEKDRRRQDGARRWSLADEPLPSRDEIESADPVAPNA
jgi:hypothetical protein